jgi:hypothetical protein
MNLYSIDIKICATAYIKAESADAAMKLAKEQFAENAPAGRSPQGAAST